MPYASDAAVEFADRSMEALSYYAYPGVRGAGRGTRPLPVVSRARCGTAGSCRIDTLELLRRRARRHASVDGPRRAGWTGTRCGRGRRARHAQLQRAGDRADRDDLEHHRRLAVDRADLPEPVREIEHVAATSPSSTSIWSANSSARPVGRGDGRRPQVLRRLAGADRPHSRRSSRNCSPRHSRSTRSWLVEAASRRQKWIDQAQSLNLYVAAPNGRKLDELYRLAWHAAARPRTTCGRQPRRTWRNPPCTAPTASSTPSHPPSKPSSTMCRRAPSTTRNAKPASKSVTTSRKAPHETPFVYPWWAIDG